MKTATLVLAPLLALALIGCPGGDDTESPAPTAAAPGPVAAPVPPGPPPFAATKLAVPLASVTSDHIRAALEGGGWEMASISSSGGLLSAMARKNGVLARVSYHNPINEAHRRRLEQDTKAVHVEGTVLLGVVVEGNEEAASQLLTSLLGGPASGGGAPAATPTPAPAPAQAAPAPAVPPQAPAGPSPWAGTAPLDCTAAQNLTINNQTVSLPGQTAITASGMCQLTLVNCTITAQTVVSASGMARVTIVGGRIEGSGASIEASGRATVTVQGAQVVGAVRRTGEATVTGAN